MDIDPEGFVEQVGDTLGILSTRVKSDMQDFKAFIEARGGTETGAYRGDIDRPS